MPEKRIVLKNCQVIDPRDINTYLEQDGFKALTLALGMPPEAVIAEVKASELRGRGGAGFLCGLKWELACKRPGDVKYLICNADEGEVGTFKDGYILQHDPFTLIEAMAIAAHAISAKQAFIYLRAEYHYLLDGLVDAIDQVKAKGFLAHLDIEIREGAGAYICGEESALMDSIEGKRGEARFKPPYPPSKGLWGKPTIINNVETLMNIPAILLNGARWFSQIGTDKSKGTKVFSVSGDVDRPGVCEFVMGSRLDEIVVDWAHARDIKMVQVGGATGGIIPYSMIETPLGFETILGSGAVTAFDKSRDVLDFVSRTVEFLAEESCGKCTPCREGTEVMLEILGRLASGDGQQEDIQTLEELSNVMALSSLCGLGQAAPTPVLDTLKYFRNEYETRIKQSVFLRSLRGQVWR
ncbi:MAG: NADH-ubiquinone oxidoreductase-F iron-sulfur binding region domain-containing protein [Anaerolineales bacterium]|nr:NADH-ubiquinone oxidoreductase-F iron-sulfur binding region domain-containing protein [Anaerolineales bacterium]